MAEKLLSTIVVDAGAGAIHSARRPASILGLGKIEVKTTTECGGSAPIVTESVHKKSYTIPCASAFRDAVEALAAARRVNVADIARSILLALPAEVIRGYPDPGGPAPGDRQTVVLKSGPAKGRPWRRKPRLQMRLAAGYDPATVRRALNLALAVAGGGATIGLVTPGADAALEDALRRGRDEIERLRTVVSVLSFEPLKNGVKSRGDALHVLGFLPQSRPAAPALRARFRLLAAIHHPDSTYGDHQRMLQLNTAMELL